jgi:hypothetical protein
VANPDDENSHRFDRFRPLVRKVLAGSRWANLLPPIAFLYLSGNWFASYLAGPQSLGYDARLYAVAARAMIEGGDPWHAQFAGGTFAGPPTTLVPYIPFAYLPGQVVAGAWIGAELLLAILILRKLRLPASWLAFPPLFSAVILGNPEVLMVAVLVLGGPLSGLAALLKPYAALPLLAERRWSAFVVAGVGGLASLALLPWGLFVADLPFIGERLQAQFFGHNAFGNPPLMVISVIALLSMGLRRALWYATPVLWPNAQLHYAAMTLPVITPLIALIWSLPLPEAITVGIVAGAINHRLRPDDPFIVRGAAGPSGS